MHTNKFLPRQFMKDLDGGASGPEHFAGLIEKHLVGCKLLDVDFEAVQVPKINYDKKNLWCNQKYLLIMFKAIRSKFASTYLALQKPIPSTTHTG